MGVFLNLLGKPGISAAGSMTFSPFGVGLALMKVAISCYVAVLNSAALQQAGGEKNTGWFVWGNIGDYNTTRWAGPYQL